MLEVGVTDHAGQGAPQLPTLRQDRGVVEVLVMAPLFCDVVFSGLSQLPGLGDEVWAKSCTIVPGGGFLIAAALHRLKVSSAWACRFGTDPFSRFGRDAARREGMDESAFIEVDRPLPNISAALSFGSDRSFISFSEPVEPIPLDSIQQLRPRVIIWPGLDRLADLERVLKAAREVGAILFLDPQSSKHTMRSHRLRSLMREVDIFAPNEREALLLTGQDSPEAALSSLIGSSHLVIVKRGDQGSVAADRRGEVRVPALPIRAIETTGAGDCFNVGFVMALLDGSDMVRCLQAGNAAGALSTAAPSSAGIPSRDEVDRALATYGHPADVGSASGHVKLEPI